MPIEPGDSSDYTFEHRGIKLVMTCRSHPEQYDAYNGRGQKIGYVRLRYGKFTVDVPFGNTIHLHLFDDEWKGEFEDQDERRIYLRDACERIKAGLKKG